MKTYEYRIFNRKFPDPTKRLYSFFYHYPLDVEKMQRAASYLVGEHDFKSFCTAKPEVTNTVRTVYSLDLKREDDMITLRIRGNGFLYNMVRIITGTLIPCGRRFSGAGGYSEDPGSKRPGRCRRDGPPGRTDTVKIEYV